MRSRFENSNSNIELTICIEVCMIDRLYVKMEIYYDISKSPY